MIDRDLYSNLKPIPLHSGGNITGDTNSYYIDTKGIDIVAFGYCADIFEAESAFGAG